MPISDLLYLKLADALSQPSKAYKAAIAGLNIPKQGMEGYSEGAKFGDELRQRKLAKSTLSEALGGRIPDGLEGFGNTTVEAAGDLAKPISAIAALQTALKEKSKKGTQLFGTRGNKGLVYDPNTNTISETPIPEADAAAADSPIVPKAVAPVLSQYADPSGQPLAFTPGQGLKPVPSRGGTPVLKAGNEQAIGDVAIMKSQIPNIDPLFDAYKQKSPIMARLQATAAGSVLDPVAKQAENSLKLAAFTFGGKNLTGQEKQVVFGAFFPSVTDNAQSLENKRALMKDYFSGKIDLLQAANLLGPAGQPLQAMLQAKTKQPNPPFGGATTPSFNSEQEAEDSGYKGPATISGKRVVIH
jgi:hypothetical protein